MMSAQHEHSQILLRMTIASGPSDQSAFSIVSCRLIVSSTKQRESLWILAQGFMPDMGST